MGYHEWYVIVLGWGRLVNLALSRPLNILPPLSTSGAYFEVAVLVHSIRSFGKNIKKL